MGSADLGSVRLTEPNPQPTPHQDGFDSFSKQIHHDLTLLFNG